MICEYLGDVLFMTAGILMILAAGKLLKPRTIHTVPSKPPVLPMQTLDESRGNHVR